MSVNAFVDHGFSEGEQFYTRLLSSREFKVESLEKLAPSPKNLTKDGLVSAVVKATEEGGQNLNNVLLTYVKQPRNFLSLKQGRFIKAPSLNSPEQFLKTFGIDGWYGPIRDYSTPQIWYLRTHKITEYNSSGSGEATTVNKLPIRWAVIAQVHPNYVALSWNGFSYFANDQAKTSIQFPYWLHIPSFFDELGKLLQGEWEHPRFHEFILHKLWSKYYVDQNFNWRHLRVRAEASGIALNAHSSKAAEVDIDLRGLKALSRRLAESVSEALGFADNFSGISCAENAILHTLIHQWGTKSYEFTLDKTMDLEDVAKELKNSQTKKVFNSHCYFGLKPNSKTPDALPHFKCYSEYGGSTKALEFLLTELGLQG